MPETTQSVSVTKHAAAQRQLAAAIRLFFMEEDELAVHTLASAAYRLVADLRSARGQDEATDYYRLGLAAAARNYRKGTLPKDANEDPKFVAMISQFADALELDEGVSHEDLAVELPVGAVRRYWNWMNRSANFLKHADKDASHALKLEEVDNTFLIALCLNSYRQLIPSGVGVEDLAFQAYLCSLSDEFADLPRQLSEFCAAMHGMPDSLRRKYLLHVIEETRSSASASHNARRPNPAFEPTCLRQAAQREH